VIASVLLARCKNPVSVAAVAKRGAYVAPIGEHAVVAEGLAYHRWVCGSSVVHELRMAASTDLELRIVRNPTAHRDPRCLERYGGSDALSLLAARDSFVTLAFVNGNFFHLVDGGFASNGFLWSAGASDGETIAPIESTLDPDYRGDRLVIAEGARATELRFTTSRCTPGECRSTVASDANVAGPTADADLDDTALVTRIRTAFPHASAALQLTPALVERESCGAARCPRVPSPYVECVAEHRWTCDPHSVTFLCVHEDRTISLLASEKALYAPLVSALSEGGTCGTECTMLYLLDGGGSTQLGFRNASDAPLRMAYAGKFDPSPPTGCATFRPVDHYLIVGRAE
jgi:hypothetical protein